MGVGSLSARVVLDDASQIYYGADRAVTGHVELSFRSGLPNDTELFGPLQIMVVLHGRAKTKIWKSNGQRRTLYRGRVPLMNVTHTIHDGPIRIPRNQLHKFPFAIGFPRDCQSIPQVEGFSSDDAIFRACDLPPTFDMNYHGLAHRFDAFNEYRMGVDVAMPGIDLSIVLPTKEMEPAVLYEQTRSLESDFEQMPLCYQHSMKIQNEHLLPESERPTGFKQRAKAFVTSDYYPQYHLTVFVTTPTHFCLAETIAFEIRVQPRLELCTAPVTPEITLTTCRVSISAQTVVRAERQVFYAHISRGNEVLLQLNGVPDSQAPFSKADDFTKRIRTQPLTGIPSTFKTLNIARNYTMSIAFTLLGANKELSFERDVAFTLHPPKLHGDAMGETVVAGPSRIEAADQLPQYEAPPSYD